MNIFAISKDPKECASYLDDKRLNKMILETAQILSTALIRLGYSDDRELLYKPTHQNHPCILWACKSYRNYHWLLSYGFYLHSERSKRFPNKPDHKSVETLKSCSAIIYHNLELFTAVPLTPFPNCAANQSLGISYKHMDDVHMAYKLYLNDRWDMDKIEPRWTGY
jgi:hypothetical protein